MHAAAKLAIKKKWKLNAKRVDRKVHIQYIMLLLAQHGLFYAWLWQEVYAVINNSKNESRAFKNGLYHFPVVIFLRHLYTTNSLHEGFCF